jgi:hypothetical protein
MYRAFAGHDPDVTPMLEFYGLPVGTSAAPAKKPTKGERG